MNTLIEFLVSKSVLENRETERNCQSENLIDWVPVTDWAPAVRHPSGVIPEGCISAMVDRSELKIVALNSPAQNEF